MSVFRNIEMWTKIRCWCLYKWHKLTYMPKLLPINMM